jgi:hypothetical protein
VRFPLQALAELFAGSAHVLAQGVPAGLLVAREIVPRTCTGWRLRLSWVRG